MAKKPGTESESLVPPTVADVVEGAAAVERMADTDDTNLKAFTAVVGALKGLSQQDKYCVLNAAAKFCGLSIKLDV